MCEQKRNVGIDALRILLMMFVWYVFVYADAFASSG